MEDVQEKILTLTNYGTDSEKPRKGNVIKTRVTVAPHMVQFVVASYDKFTELEGIEIRRVNVLMTGGEQIELFLSLLDLTTLERAVGTYLLPS